MLPMTAGSDALAGAYAKLDRAEQLHQKMHDVFECLVREDEPYTMQFESLNKPAGMVIARFKIDKPIPHAMSVIAGESSTTPASQSTTPWRASRTTSAVSRVRAHFPSAPPPTAPQR